MKINGRKKRNNSALSKNYFQSDNTVKKIDLVLNIELLDLLCSYVTSENSKIKNSSIIKLRNLYDIIDQSQYVQYPERMERLRYIERGLIARLDKGLNSKKVIDLYIRNGGLSEFNFYPQELSSNDVEFIKTTVNNILSWSFINDDINDMIDICTRFKSGDFNDRANIVQEYIEKVKSQNNTFRQLKNDENSDIIFSLRDGIFEEAISQTYDTITNPNRFLYSGMQGMNDMVGGAFEMTRTYLFAGRSGVGKSAFLLNLAYQFKIFNKGYRPKDPTKTPAIIYLTQENNLCETIERLQLMINDVDMADQTKDEIIHKLRTDGELVLNDQNNIDLIMLYKPDQTIDCGDLFSMVEDFEDEGYEIIALIQDHIKKLRPLKRQKELRLDLGAIANELKTLATLKEMVVITNTHLNRAADTKIQQSTGKQADPSLLLGRDNISESMLMVDNTDYTFILNKDYYIENNMKLPVLSIQALKFRKGCKRQFLYYNFTNPNHPLRLVTDFGLEPKFFETLSQTGESGYRNVGGVKMKKSPCNQFVDVDEENVHQAKSQDEIDFDEFFISSTPTNGQKPKILAFTFETEEAEKKACEYYNKYSKSSRSSLL